MRGRAGEGPRPAGGGSRAARWLRGASALAAVLIVIEGLAILADQQWGFRARLLAAFRTASRVDAADEDRLWSDPEAPFRAAAEASSPPLRFRTGDSWNPAGEPIDPGDLPPGRRVVVLGESAAFGVGCRADETFAARLGGQVGGGVPVLNAGQVGADAWEVLAAGAETLQRYAPSTLVIFTGNNLWIDWVPPQQQRWNPWAIRALSTLATSRAIAALEFLAIRTALLHTPRKWRVENIALVDGLLSRLPVTRDRQTADGFRDHVELMGSAYALAHPLEETPTFGPADWSAVKSLYLQRFETSLEELVHHARDRGVQVVLVTMPFSVRLSPAWKHPQFEAYDAAHRDEVRALLHQAGGLVQAGDCAAALPIVERALALDPEPPLLSYLKAECLERSGDLDGARAAYAQSREHMLGNLGSRLSINAVIRRVAARNRVPLVDAAQLFEDWGRANGDPFHEQLILDDCHPSAAGHRLIADALAAALGPGGAPVTPPTGGRSEGD